MSRENERFETSEWTALVHDIVCDSCGKVIAKGFSDCGKMASLYIFTEQVKDGSVSSDLCSLKCGARWVKSLGGGLGE